MLTKFEFLNPKFGIFIQDWKLMYYTNLFEYVGIFSLSFYLRDNL
jgi:hypothetical protein